jgi:hypothetical protein
LEQQNIYDRFPPDTFPPASPYFNRRVARQLAAPWPDTWWEEQTTTMGTLSQINMNILICPSATQEQYLPAYVQSHIWYDTSVPEEFQFIARTDVDNFPPGVPEIGRTNYLACAGRAGNLGNPSALTPIAKELDRYEGVFTTRSQNTGGAMRDGGSNTFLFGESVGQENDNQVLQASHSWMGSNIAITYFGLRPPAPLPKRQYNNFSSYHDGVVFFVMVDGAVKGISEEIDNAVFWAYGGKSDRDVIPDQQ